MSTFMESNIALNFEDANSYHDRVLIVGEKKFYEIELKDLDADIFEIFLRSLYQHSLPVLKVDDIIPLIELSYRFLAPMVLNQCKEYIDANFEQLDEVKLQLLETACSHGFEILKEKLTNNLKNESQLSKLSCTEVLEVCVEYKLADLKDSVALFMKHNVTYQNCSEFLDCCEKFKLVDLKADISEAVSIWEWKSIPADLIIDLTRSAFKHDVKNLKKRLRVNIYYMSKSDAANTFRERNGETPALNHTYNWFLKDYQEEIFELPAEISKFITISTCRNKM